MGKVLGKVSNCQTQLQLWDKHTFENVCILLAQKRKQLVQVEAVSMAGRNHAHLQQLNEEGINVLRQSG